MNGCCGNEIMSGAHATVINEKNCLTEFKLFNI